MGYKTKPKKICKKCGDIIFNRRTNAEYCKKCSKIVPILYRKKYYNTYIRR